MNGEIELQEGDHTVILTGLSGFTRAGWQYDVATLGPKLGTSWTNRF
jgi:hypothetical protein